jgi:hypothetical protein
LIRWSEIEAEAQGFRQGLVALFRKYEGQPTDQKDGQGRVVKVTPRSFAEHMGIGEKTFRIWLRKSETGSDLLKEQAKQKTQEIERWHIRRAARQQPQAIVEAVSELPEEAQQQIVRELHKKQLARAGADFSEAGRKARQAATSEQLEPLRRSLNAMKVLATLEQAADELRNLPANLTEEDHREIDAAVDDVILARTEMHMRAEVGD